MDRFGKGVVAVLMLVCIKDWGFGLDWQQLSYVSVVLIAVWILVAIAAKREYMRSFRRSIEQQIVEPKQLRFTNPDPSSVETLVTELAHPDPKRALYAIDLLDAMDKRHLVTPLLLAHDSADVRARTLSIAESAGPALADRWLPGVERALKDREGAVRIAAVSALAALRGGAAADVMRPFISGNDPALAIVAAAALAGSSAEADLKKAEDTLRRYSADTRARGTEWRLHVARALGDVRNPSFRPLLVPLMYDDNLEVARAAIESAGRLGADDFLFVAPLVSLLRNRRLKPAARAVLIGYGEPVVAPLAYFMRDREEDKWVRRHVPSTLASLPFPSSMEALLGALDENDGFIRFKAVAALDRLRRSHPDLPINRDIITRHVNTEAARAFNAMTLHYNLFVAGGLDVNSLLARALVEKRTRALNRTLTLLGLIQGPDDVAIVRHALRIDDARLRSRAIEYLDNLLEGDTRKRVMLLVEEMPAEERIRKGNVMYRTRIRDVEDTIAQLLHDERSGGRVGRRPAGRGARLWSLADDLEHVLAHRDVARSGCVRGGVVGAGRPPHAGGPAQAAVAGAAAGGGTGRPPAPHSAVLISRTSTSCSVSHGWVARCATKTGRTLYQRDAAAAHRAVPARWPLATTGADGQSRRPPRRRRSAVEEMLEGVADARLGHVATEPAITLSMSTDEFLALLSENVELAEGIFRMMIESRGLGTGHTLIHGTSRPSSETECTTICSRSIACCCCSRVPCSRMPRRRSCGGCRRLPGRSRSLPARRRCRGAARPRS